MKIRVKVLQNDQKNVCSLQLEFEEHKKQADEAYNAKRNDKEMAENNSSFKVIAFDSQQCLPTPNLTTNVSFYKRKLLTFNLTLHDCNSKEVLYYMWH